MSEELKAAQARIACLEGEIAKRDEELAACRVAVENCEVFRARIAELEHRCGMYGLELTNEVERRLQAERQLSALKAQEPVAYISGCYRDVIDGKSDRTPLGAELAFVNMGWIGQIPLYAAPVSEAKAQGVVMPEPMKRGDEGGSGEYGAAMIRGYNACLREVARLNAAPVQQVSVPDGWKHGLPPEGEICEARIPHHTADGRQMIWCEVEVIAHSIIKGAIYSWVKETGQDGSFYAPMMLSFRKLAAAPAAPAADAWIPVSERLPDVPDGDEREVIVCVKRAHNGQSYSFSARYLNNFPLHSDSEDEPAFVTGWYDVKEHAEYDGWYSPLIDSSSGDEVTHWLPLPAAPSANSDKGVV